MYNSAMPTDTNHPFPNVAPYIGVFFDELWSPVAGRTFRLLGYTAIRGRPEEPLAAAVLDEDSKLVLLDGLYRDESTPVRVIAAIQRLKTCSIEELVTVLMAHPDVRHTLSPTGAVGWDGPFHES